MIHDIAAGLAAAMSTVDGLRTSAHPVEVVSATPLATVQLAGIDYHQSFGNASLSGLAAIRWQVDVIVGRVALRATTESLEQLVDHTGTRYTSVVAAIEADKTLGGVCSTLIVQRVSSVGATAVGDDSYLVARLEVLTYGE